MTVDTQFGFRWGPLEVERVCHDEKKIGYILQVKTNAGKAIEIRVSPKGTKITTNLVKPY